MPPMEAPNMVPTPSKVSHRAMALPSLDFSTCRLAKVSAAGGTADSPMAGMILTTREATAVPERWIP